MLVSALLSFIGAVIFETLHGEPDAPKVARGSGRLPALTGGGIRTVVAIATLFELTFGVLDVAFPALAREHGSAAGVSCAPARTTTIARRSGCRRRRIHSSGELVWHRAGGNERYARSWGGENQLTPPPPRACSRCPYQRTRGGPRETSLGSARADVGQRCSTGSVDR